MLKCFVHFIGLRARVSSTNFRKCVGEFTTPLWQCHRYQLCSYLKRYTQFYFCYSLFNFTAEVCVDPVRARPVGSFMHREDLKEYARNLMTLAKKDLEKRNRRHFAFSVYKTSRKSV